MTLLGGVAVGLEPTTVLLVVDLGGIKTPGELVIACFVVGAVGGLFAVYCLSDLIRWVASRFGGVATSKEMRAAMAWSQVPAIWALLWLPLAFGVVGTTSSIHVRPMGSPPPIVDPEIAFLCLAAARIVLLLWRAVTFLKVVAEVNRFSAWRAMLAAIFSALLILMPLFILMVALGG